MNPKRVPDAILIVSFGGPEGAEDVLPFLEKVTRGRGVPRERLLEVAEHYHHFGGVSPINGQNRALIAALERLLAAEGPALPVYWGNRNWHPLLPDAIRQMARDGVTRAYAFVTSAFGSFSGCRQYRENLERARAEVGPAAPEILKLRLYWDHPGFLEPVRDSLRRALAELPGAKVLFTAHSIPEAMAQTSPYVEQLREACRRVAGDGFELVYQSRSGSPAQPWLGPDINGRLRELAAEGVREVVIVPIGFVSDHMEVLYDLDTEARETCEGLGMRMVRAATVGCDARFVRMIRDLVVEEQVQVCLPGCCVAPQMARPVKIG